MTGTVNMNALENARQLIQDGKYRINTMWKTVQPSTAEIDQFRKRADGDEFSKWFLVIDDQKSEVDPNFALGDFRNVHRSGLQNMKRHAEKEGRSDVVNAANELIDLIDHFNAC